MDSWEYMYERLRGWFWSSEGEANEHFMAKLQELGAEGWEVAALRAQSGTRPRDPNYTECLFKRKAG